MELISGLVIAKAGFYIDVALYVPDVSQPLFGLRPLFGVCAGIGLLLRLLVAADAAADEASSAVEERREGHEYDDDEDADHHERNLCRSQSLEKVEYSACLIDFEAQ